MFNCIPVDWLGMTLLAASLLHLLWFSFLNNWSLCIGTGRKYTFTIPNFPPLTMTKLWSFWKQGYICLVHGYIPNPLCIVGAQYVFVEWMPGLKQEPISMHCEGKSGRHQWEEKFSNCTNCHKKATLFQFSLGGSAPPWLHLTTTQTPMNGWDNNKSSKFSIHERENATTRQGNWALC